MQYILFSQHVFGSEYDRSLILTLGRSRSFHFKKLGLQPNAEAKGVNFVNFALRTPSEAIIVKWSASNIIS